MTQVDTVRTLLFVTPIAIVSAEQFHERIEDVPTDPPAGAYVLVDACYFSTTVVELLSEGAAFVDVRPQGDEHAVRETHPEALVGGEGTGSFEPAAGYDFFNSPTDVQRLDLAGRPVGFSSNNGGGALRALADRLGPDSALYVGSTTNARALAAHLAERPVYPVAVGAGGRVAVEDNVAAAAIARRLADGRPDPAERAALAGALRLAKGRECAKRTDGRGADIGLIADVRSRPVVSRVSDVRVVDVV